jgi:hypothetical protein
VPDHVNISISSLWFLLLTLSELICNILGLDYSRVNACEDIDLFRTRIPNTLPHLTGNSERSYGLHGRVD